MIENILAALRNNNQAIIKLAINTGNVPTSLLPPLPLTLINVVNFNNPKQVRWYYVLNQNAQGNASYSNTENSNIITNPQNISWSQVGTLIDLSTQVPQYDRSSRYRISVVVSRLRLNNNNVPENIKFLHGTYWQGTPNTRVFDPVNLMIYTSIWLERIIKEEF
jgi:hypothetical protein